MTYRTHCVKQILQFPVIYTVEAIGFTKFHYLDD